MKREGEKFIEYCGITAGENSLKKIRNKLAILNRFFKNNTDKLKLEDIHRFLSWVNKSDYARSTKNDIIKVFKRFLKWKYKDWNVRFNELKDAKTNGNDGRRLDKEDLLTAEEMKLIINSIDNMKYKTLLLLFQETACRPEEILKLKWRDINWDRGEVKLYSNKTGKTRFIPIHNSKGHLNRYKAECFPTTPKADDKVFDISDQAVLDYLLKLEKRIGFTKHLYPYLWRHSVLSGMIKKLSPKVYEMFAGHSLEIGMRIYSHLDNDDLREELNEKIYHIEKLTEKEKEEIKKLKKRIGNVEGFLKEFITRSMGEIRKKGKFISITDEKGEEIKPEQFIQKIALSDDKTPS